MRKSNFKIGDTVKISDECKGKRNFKGRVGIIEDIRVPDVFVEEGELCYITIDNICMGYPDYLLIPYNEEG